MADPHDAIYDVLVACCGAIEHNRARFRALELVPGAHIVFGGQLGLDGKFGVSSGGEWFVYVAPEDSNPKRERMMVDANDALAKLQGR